MYYNNYNTAGRTAKNHYSKHYKRPGLRSKEGMTRCLEWNRAIAALQVGRMIVLIDDAERENEGDLVMAAGIRHDGGDRQFHDEVCARHHLRADAGGRFSALGTAANGGAYNTDAHGTAFTVSVDAVDTTTGVSPAERAHTLRLLANPPAGRPLSVARGMCFRCGIAKARVFARRGHTGLVGFAPPGRSGKRRQSSAKSPPPTADDATEQYGVLPPSMTCV